MDDMGSFRIDVEIESIIAPEALGIARRQQRRFRQADGSVLEGLNLQFDPVAKRLSDAGPMPLACASQESRSQRLAPYKKGSPATPERCEGSELPTMR
jgi:hypothetical protein